MSKIKLEGSEHSAKTLRASSKTSSVKYVEGEEENTSTTPDFIYGGPFIQVEKPCPFMDTATPMNLQLQGTFKKSFAYYSLKERLPVILTKIIDFLSREGSKISGAADQDVKALIQHIAKLKNDLITNKRYSKLEADTPDAKRWNEWIEQSESQYYFTNTWVFTECYVYRKLRDGCEILKTLQNFDPFEAQKAKSFTNSLEPMCVVADKMMSMLPASDKDKRKADFITLIKTCLWANKCDLSLSAGTEVTLNGVKTEGKVSSAGSGVIDPFQMIIDMKDKILVDDSAKAVDQIIAKAEAMAKTIEGAETIAAPATAAPVEGGEGKQEGEAEEPKVPCPAKMTIPQSVMFDIVCDNAGYELFADLCLAHFLISQKIVQKVRFHVKKIPWFVSDVTPKDFKYIIDQCKTASFSKSVPQEPKPDAVEGEAPPEPRVIGAENLQQLGHEWSALVEDGTFIVMADDFWTSPHVYKDMKKYDYNLYRKLQYAVAIMFKGDLNYRKLLCEKNCNPIVGFEPSLQGFIPAPILAVRTVKADLICGLPKGKWQQLTNLDDKWMQKGDYGVIQFCPKAEALKVADRPCLDYGDECLGKICPIHTDI